VTWFSNLYEWLKVKIPEAFEAVRSFFTEKVPEWVGNMISSVKSVVSGVISWIESLNPFGKKGKDTDKGHAAGGLVPVSGEYKLHAGERIIPAGQAQRGIKDRNININNTFNIPATINSELDIRKLAMQLADLNERELRRRVSYF